jgi:hypothetical protein
MVFLISPIPNLLTSRCPKTPPLHVSIQISSDIHVNINPMFQITIKEFISCNYVNRIINQICVKKKKNYQPNQHHWADSHAVDSTILPQILHMEEPRPILLLLKFVSNLSWCNSHTKVLTLSGTLSLQIFNQFAPCWLSSKLHNAIYMQSIRFYDQTNLKMYSEISRHTQHSVFLHYRQLLLIINTKDYKKNWLEIQTTIMQEV